MERPNSLLIAFFVLALGAVSFQGLGVKAQTEVVDFYAIEGTVASFDGRLLEGALVSLRSANEDGFDGQEEQEVVTGDDGSFHFDVLPASFIVEASHACCGPAKESVIIGASDFGIHEVNLVLPAQGAEGDRVLLSGRVIDDATGKGLAGARIEVSNWYGEGQSYQPADGNESQVRPEYCCDGQYESFSIISADDGSYSVSLHPGRVNLWVDLSGYDITRAEFPLDEDRQLDIPLRQGGGDLATISGTVSSSAGGPVERASVSVSPDWEDQCRYEACPVSDPVYREPASETQGDVVFYYEPRDTTYGWAETDSNGHYTISVRGGNLVASVWAPNHVQAQKRFTATNGEEKTVDFELEQIPKKSVAVSGRVLDAETREPIPFAEVSGQNERWGDWIYNQTDENGKFSFNARPGYTIITVSAYRYYWVPCDEPQPMREEKMAAEGVSSDSMIWPGPSCDGQRERDHEYLPRSQVIVFDPGESQTLDFELKRAPPPDAAFQGWVVNATSDEPIPEAHVSFYNEETREWGEAVTGDDGSYKIRVRHGYFTVRTYVDGYYSNAQNVEIGEGETVQLNLKLEPGRPSYGYCCYAYAERGAVAADMAVSSEMSYASPTAAGGAPPPGAPAGMGDTDEEMAAGGAAGDGSGQTANKAYAGEVANLGAYDPDAPPLAVLETGDDESAAPGAGLVLGLMAMAGAALLLGRRTAKK